MPQGHLILLANFYGSYLNKSKFRATVIVNNAGIEQLATLGVEKVKEVKANGSSKDGIYVLVVAGLTDVLIKSVEEGKNKLEITPNSTQLLETKMQWAHSLLNSEGAKIIWAIMPPISLRMYHISEGWNINKIPGMSGGLDQEQRSLNTLMFNYRHLCMKLNYLGARKICNGPYFTDLVSELSQDRGSMNLITGYFESDGISPTAKLIENWTSQVDKIFLAIDNLHTSRPHAQPRSRTPPQLLPGLGNGDSWDLPPPRGRVDERGEHSLKRSYDDDSGYPATRGLHGLGSGVAREMENARKVMRDQAYDQYPSRSGDDLTSKIPSLIDMAKSFDQPRRHLDNHVAHSSADQPRRRPDNPLVPSLVDQPTKEMATAVQLLAATMQLGGGNASDMQTVLSALMSQKKDDGEKRRLEDDRVKRRMEEDRAALKKQEEARRLADMRRIEESRRKEVQYREEMRRREEDKRREERLLEEKRAIEANRRREEEERLRQVAAQRRAAAEDQRLREIQIAAKLAMEQQKREEERQRQVKLIQDQQAQLALMAVTKQVREQMAQKKAEPTASPFSAADAQAKATNALDRINEKLKNDREKKDTLMKFDRKIAADPLWAAPVVLFSFLNRSNERRPLRGIFGQKIARSSTKASDVKSRGQWIYNEPGAPPLSVGLLKIKLKKPGLMSEFESKVADYNNRMLDMMDEADYLLQQGRAQSYIIRRESDEPKIAAKSSGSSAGDEKSIRQESKPATSSFGSVEKSKEMSSTKSSGSKVKDLRENLSRSSRRHARSRSPGELKKQTSSQVVARRSTETKPRWDKSDESEEELLWDDDQGSVKAAVEDDDVQIVEEQDAKRKDKNHEPARGVVSAKDDNKPSGTIIKTVNSDRFATRDEQSGRHDHHVDENVDNFLTIDETA